MPFISMLSFKSHDGNGAKLAELHMRRRCVEEAAETISGFIAGKTMLCEDDPSRVLVMCTWENKSAYQEWLDSPVRAAQTADLIDSISADVEALTYQSLLNLRSG
ncbi:antibiotic biosynthesis monooxygenase family protein [Vibrio vulnificus]